MLRGKRVLGVEEMENEVQRKRERDAKRPKLRLGLGGAGQPGEGGSTSSATTTSTANSFNSDRSNSSKATTVSPNSSLAPSPVLDVKPDTCSLIASLANSVATAPSQPHFHYQPAPLPITLNPSQPSLSQSFYPASSIAPATMQPMAFAPFAPDSLSDYYSGSADEYASLAPTLINPVALPELPVPPPLDLPASVIAEEAGPPAPTYAPKKRGRKPKNAPPATAVDLEQDRREALDRNRVAASRSRQRKKERVGNLESSESLLLLRLTFRSLT